MKTIQKIVLIAFFASINSVLAQNGYYGNGYDNGYGGGNRMSQMGNQFNEPEKPKEIPPEVTATKIVEDMKPALTLDDLQVIAIKNVLIESIKAQGVLMKQQQGNQEALMENYKLLAESTDQKINQFLNKDQKEKYIIYKENRGKKKEKSKKDKSKKEKEKLTQE